MCISYIGAIVSIQGVLDLGQYSEIAALEALHKVNTQIFEGKPPDGPGYPLKDLNRNLCALIEFSNTNGAQLSYLLIKNWKQWG